MSKIKRAPCFFHNYIFIIIRDVSGTVSNSSFHFHLAACSLAFLPQLPLLNLTLSPEVVRSRLPIFLVTSHQLTTFLEPFPSLGSCDIILPAFSISLSDSVYGLFPSSWGPYAAPITMAQTSSRVCICGLDSSADTAQGLLDLFISQYWHAPNWIANFSLEICSLLIFFLAL